MLEPGHPLLVPVIAHRAQPGIQDRHAQRLSAAKDVFMDHALLLIPARAIMAGNRAIAQSRSVLRDVSAELVLTAPARAHV